MSKSEFTGREFEFVGQDESLAISRWPDRKGLLLTHRKGCRVEILASGIKPEQAEKLVAVIRRLANL